MKPPRLLVGTLLPILLLAAPAVAQRYEPPRPSPCDFFIPTGEPLPRQDESFQNTMLYAVPNPVYRDRRTGSVGKGEPVTVLQECGLKLRVRTVRGEEGWMNTASLPNELKLMERTAKRPIETDRDCEQRILDPQLVAQCKARLAVARAQQEEARTSANLGSEELRRFLAGKTLVLTPRRPEPYSKPEPMTGYFAPDGEVFLVRGVDGNGILYRGRWTADGELVCLPAASLPCAKLRKVGGQVVWVEDRGKEFALATSEGDTAGIVVTVSKFYPKPVPPPAPTGSPFAAPSMGRAR